MKWLTNLYNPRRPDAWCHIARRHDETLLQAYSRHKEWLEDKIIGRPKATDTHSVAELEAMDLVGIYDPS